MTRKIASQIARAVRSADQGFDASRTADSLRNLPDAPAVIRLLTRSSDFAVRMAAVDLAARVLMPDDSFKLLQNLATADDNPDVRDASIELLVASPSFDRSGVAASLRQRLSAIESQPELLFAIWTLARLRDSESLSELSRLRTSYQWAPGRRAADIAAALIEGRHEQLIDRLLRHDHVYRLELSIGLGLLGTPEAQAALSRQSAQAPDEVCRKVAQWALQKYFAESVRSSSR